jgi:hypothetical protein
MMTTAIELLVTPGALSDSDRHALQFNTFSGLWSQNLISFNVVMNWDAASSVSFRCQFEGNCSEEEAEARFLAELVKPPPKKYIESTDTNGAPLAHPLLGKNCVTVTCGSRPPARFDQDAFTLLWAARNEKLVLVMGTGVTMSITGKPTSMWSGFLSAVRQNVWPPTDAGSFSDADFQALHTDAHAQSEYLLYCAERDERIQKVNAVTLKIMNDLGLPSEAGGIAWRDTLENFAGLILTFNYDISLEVATGRYPKVISRLGTHPVVDCLHNVVHLHGIFTDEESIVLKQKTYIDAAKVVPSVFYQLADDGRVFVYAGVSGVLSDPDLSPFWRYEEIHHKIKKDRPAPRTHFVITRKNDQPNVPKGNGGDAMSFFGRIPFQEGNGTDYGELPRLLKRIVTGTDLHKLEM